MSKKESPDIEMCYGDSSSLTSFTPSPSEGHLPVCDGLDTKGETQDQLPGGLRSPEWVKESSEQLPYPTMCEDGQETGYGRRTVVYGVNGWCSVIKEPDEAEDNCTSLERNQPEDSNIMHTDVSDIGENVEISNSCGSDGNSSSRSDGKTEASQNHNDEDDEGGDGIDDDDDDDDDVEDNDDDVDDDDGDDEEDDEDYDDDDEDDNDDHNDNGGEDKMEVHKKCEITSTGLQFEISLAELDHSTYCDLKDCPKWKCKYVKHQLKYHKKNHKGWEKCLTCKTVSAVIEEHSKQCKFPGCWVEHCDRNRAENLVPTCGETNRAAIRSIEGKKEDNNEHQAKMKVEEYTEDSCIVALDIAEQYNTEGLKVDVSPADLLHGSYCRKLNCYNKKCRVVKTEIKHFRTHQARQCTRCEYLLSVIQHHAQTCQMRGTCRVPGCENTRNRGNVGYPVPRHKVVQKVPALLTCALGRGNNLLTPGKRKSQRQKSTSADDGLSSENPYCGTVLFWHPKRDRPVKKVKEHEDYHVQRSQSLGAGVNGTVYPAYWYLESGTREEFAIKKTNFSVEEVKVYEKLEDHPHLVTHYAVAFSSEHKKVNIFMELCDGSLFTYMKELNRRLTDKEAMNFFIQVLIAVCYLHSLGIIHKDLKAKNVMRKGNVAKVGDFDTAKILTEEMTEAGLHPRGTRGFAALEVMAMKPHGRPADVFSLGVLLLELTIGAPSGDPESLVLKIKELEAKYADLAKLVKACVQEDPMLRPTASSLLDCKIVRNYRSLNSDPLPCLQLS